MKNKKILISLIFTIIILLLFAYGKVEASVSTEVKVNKEVDVVGFAGKKQVVRLVVKVTDRRIKNQKIKSDSKYKVEYFLNDKCEGSFYLENSSSENITELKGTSNKIYIGRDETIIYKVCVNGKSKEFHYTSRPPEFVDVKFNEDKKGMEVKVRTYKDTRYNYNLTSITIVDINDKNSGKGDEAALTKIEEGLTSVPEGEYNIWTIPIKKDIKLNAAFRISAANGCGTVLFDPYYLRYSPPKICNVEQKDAKIQFEVEKTEYDIESIMVYKVDKDEKIIDEGERIELKTGKLVYGNESNVARGQKFVIVAKDIYGAINRHYFTTKEASNYGVAGYDSSSYNYGGTQDDTSAPTCTSVEFLKSDGTWVESNQNGNTYSNKAINEDITVKITFNKAVSIENNTSDWTISTGNVITRTFSESKIDSIYVKPISGGNISTINLDVKIDKIAPVIKINGQEVNTFNSKTIIQDRDEKNQADDAEETNYNLPIDVYEEGITIEVSDDQIDEKEIDKYVKLQKEEIIEGNIIGFDNEFKNAMKLSTLGTYTIEATDEAGNIAIYKFKIATARNLIEIDSEIIKITQDGKAVITLEPNSTRKTFENELKLNVETEVYIQKKGENKGQADNNDYIKTGMKLVIGGVEYDIIVAGDIDGDGMIEVTDIRLAEYILNANGKNGISLDQEWSFDIDIKEDANGDGKVDEKDIEAVKARLDVNEDGEFDEEDERLIKYALDINGDGIFDKTDLNLLNANRTDENDEELEEDYDKLDIKENDEEANIDISDEQDLERQIGNEDW